MVDVERGNASPNVACGCDHATCALDRARRGTPERGMS
jgi:hypothetical protein